jgi:formylglycine-generating enzyme required for sulfatase activity
MSDSIDPWALGGDQTELEELVFLERQVRESSEESFVKLLKIAKLDPSLHLRFGDFNGMDFSGCDLSGCDFTGANMTGCRFDGAKIADGRFDRALLHREQLHPSMILGAVARLKRNFQITESVPRDYKVTGGEVEDWDEHVRRWAKAERPVGDEHLPDLAVFSDAPFAPEMIVVPAGESWMGSYETAEFEEDEFKYRGERSPYRGTIDDRFAIGRYAVTFEEFDRFCVSQGRAKLPDEGWGRGRRPVINVSWSDAQEYLSWLCQITCRKYRLPTETEWEYACRAGTATEFTFGDHLSSRHAHFGRFNRTAEVGSYIPNAWGIYDMHGNVCEWVGRDESKSNRSLYKPKSGSRVVRGGYFGGPPQDCRSGHPEWWKSDTMASFIGFRVACDL